MTIKEIPHLAPRVWGWQRICERKETDRRPIAGIPTNNNEDSKHHIQLKAANDSQRPRHWLQPQLLRIALCDDDNLLRTSLSSGVYGRTTSGKLSHRKSLQEQTIIATMGLALQRRDGRYVVVDPPRRSRYYEEYTRYGNRTVHNHRDGSSTRRLPACQMAILTVRYRGEPYYRHQNRYLPAAKEMATS